MTILHLSAKEIFFSLLHFLKSHSIITNVVGMWLSLVERIVRDDEVAGSNPVIPTIYATYKDQPMGGSFSIYDGL